MWAWPHAPSAPHSSGQEHGAPRQLRRGGAWDVRQQLFLQVPNASMLKSQNIFAEMRLRVMGRKLISRTPTSQRHEPQPEVPRSCLFSSDLIQGISVPIDLGLLMQSHLFYVLYGDRPYSQEARQHSLLLFCGLVRCPPRQTAVCQIYFGFCSLHISYAFGIDNVWSVS